MGAERSLMDYRLDFWRDAEGLNQKYIKTILQTRDGYPHYCDDRAGHEG